MSNKVENQILHLHNTVNYNIPTDSDRNIHNWNKLILEIIRVEGIYVNESILAFIKDDDFIFSHRPTNVRIMDDGLKKLGNDLHRSWVGTLVVSYVVGNNELHIHMKPQEDFGIHITRQRVSEFTIYTIDDDTIKHTEDSISEFYIDTLFENWDSENVESTKNLIVSLQGYHTFFISSISEEPIQIKHEEYVDMWETLYHVANRWHRLCHISWMIGLYKFNEYEIDTNLYQHCVEEEEKCEKE